MDYYGKIFIISFVFFYKIETDLIVIHMIFAGSGIFKTVNSFPLPI